MAGLASREELSCGLRVRAAGEGGARLAGAGPIGEEGLHGERILHGSDDAQPAPSAGTGEDIVSEHAPHQRGPSPRVRGTGYGGLGAGSSDVSRFSGIKSFSHSALL